MLFGKAIDGPFLPHIIEGEVCVFLKDANFTKPLWADSGNGEIGDTAVFEAQTRIGNVFAFA